MTAGFAAVKSLASGGDILSTVTKAAGIGVLITTAADSPFGKKVINAGTDLAGGALDSIKSAFNDLPVEKQAEEIATATAAITSKSNDALAQVQRAGNAFTRSV